MQTRIRTVLASILAAALMGGCATMSELLPKDPPPPPTPMDVVAAPYSGNALQNFYIGRQYVAQGRYELAREHYLLALASAREEAMRDTLVTELQTVDRLIKTLR